MPQLFRVVVANHSFFASSEMNAFEIIQQFVISQATDLICDFVGFSNTDKDKKITRSLVIKAHPIIEALKEANNVTDFSKTYAGFCELLNATCDSLRFSSQVIAKYTTLKSEKNIRVFLRYNDFADDFFARDHTSIQIIDLSDQIDSLSIEAEYSKVEFQKLYESFSVVEVKNK